MKNILVTGNLGYIGSVLTDLLISADYSVTGYDCGFFKNCKIKKTKQIKHQIVKDIRDITEQDLKNIECIVHLAALSNDPLGQFDKKITYDINYYATIKLAKLAKKNNIKKFIFISTQSIYGISKKRGELKEHDFKNPITAYARSKWLAEKHLNKIFDINFQGIILRPATVFGPSPRFRSDIILNNFVGWAYNKKVIKIFSDGSPFRPILYIKDLCNLIIEIIKKDISKISGEAYNVGVYKANYSVLELAKKVQNLSSKKIRIVIKNNAGSDQRTYQVSFLKMKNYFLTKMQNHNIISKGIKELFFFYKKNKINYSKFSGPLTVRLEKLKVLKKRNRVDKNLRLIK
jgi:nucleoside-diphosphate-sugar epimerase